MSLNREDSNTRPTEIFISAIGDAAAGCGSEHILCGWCGRHHYAVDVDVWFECTPETSWKEYCENIKKKYPDKTILHYGVNSIYGCELNGIMFVVECPCNALSRYEEFIWNHRELIKFYIKNREVQEKQWDIEQSVIDKLLGTKL